MPTIEEYRAKKLLTDKLRAQQAAYQGADFDPMNVTRGSMGGTYQMPDIYQANIAGPLAKVAGAWLGGKKGAEADASEQEAEQIKQGAVDEMLGAGKTITPQQAIKLQELGIDVGDISKYMPTAPKPPALGAQAQLASGNMSPATKTKLLNGQQLTQADLDENQAWIDKQAEAESQRKIREQAAGRTPAAAAATTPYDQAKQKKAELEMVVLDMSKTPEERQAAQQTLESLRAGGGSAGSGLSVREEKEVLGLEKKISDGDGDIRRLEEAATFINSPKAKTIFGPAQWGAQVLKNTGVPFLTELGTAGTNPELADLNSKMMGFVLTDMQALGGSDSNEELRTLRARYPDASHNYESARKLINEARRFKKIDIQSARLQAAARRNGTYDNGVNYYREAERMLGLGGDGVPIAPEALAQPQSAPAQAGAGGLDPAKAARLAELRRKQQEGTLQ